MQEVIAELRNIRSEMKLDPKKKVAAEFSSSDGYIRDTIAQRRRDRATGYFDGVRRFGDEAAETGGADAFDCGI